MTCVTGSTATLALPAIGVETHSWNVTVLGRLATEGGDGGGCKEAETEGGLRDGGGAFRTAGEGGTSGGGEGREGGGAFRIGGEGGVSGGGRGGGEGGAGAEGGPGEGGGDGGSAVPGAQHSWGVTVARTP